MDAAFYRQWGERHLSGRVKRAFLATLDELAAKGKCAKNGTLDEVSRSMAAQVLARPSTPVLDYIDRRMGVERPARSAVVVHRGRLSISAIGQVQDGDALRFGGAR